MRRITPAEVVAAYEAHPDIKPTKNVYRRMTGDQVSMCCGTCALALKENSEFALLIGTTPPGHLPSLIVFSLHVDVGYLSGFMFGWDQGAVGSPSNEAERIAREDGLAAMKAVTDKFGEFA